MVGEREPQVVVEDSEGRFVVVRAEIHGHDTLIVVCHADNKSDAEQAKYYTRLEERLQDLKAQHWVMMGDFNKLLK